MNEDTATHLPPNLHAVVFFRGERGPEHLDVRVVAEGSVVTISGVRADESRAHPPTRRIVLSDAERARYADLIVAISEMPRCEPIAVLDDDPMFHFDGEGHDDSGPSLWLRDDGESRMESDDPCLGYVRLAHFIYTTWMAHEAEL